MAFLLLHNYTDFIKRELGFVLMALNIRKIAAQRAVHYKIHIKKADFYQIINRNQLFYIA